MKPLATFKHISSKNANYGDAEKYLTFAHGKREGYSLTKNDFTDILKAKLDGIEEKANYITVQFPVHCPCLYANQDTLSERS